MRERTTCMLSFLAARRPVFPLLAADARGAVLVETRITFVGADGDGIGAHPDGSRLYVPLTVPGDTVRVRPLARRGDGWAGEIDTILQPGLGRREPACRHFGVCGGCTSQHWDKAEYLAWKVGRLTAALRRAGFDEPAVRPIV